MGMVDITVLSDQKSNMFEPVFREYGFSCQQVVPQAFGSPFCPPSKLLIIPTGFANPKFYKILPALEGCKGRIEEFAEDGGIVLVFGALIDGHEYRWLSMEARYRSLSKKQEVLLIDKTSPASLMYEPGLRGCDGYFPEHDGRVVMTLEDGNPVLIHRAIGDGHIIVSGIFDYPDKRFIAWACPK